MEYHNIPWNSTEFSMEFHEIPPTSVKFHGKFHAIPWNSMENFMNSRNDFRQGRHEGERVQERRL
jgi:hypothetical protein